MRSVSLPKPLPAAKHLLFALALVVLLPFLPPSRVEAAACSSVPNRPGLVVPANKAQLSHRRAILQWNSVACAATYSVQVRKDEKYGRPMDAASNLDVTTYRTRKLERGKTYFWSVDACNRHGCTSSRWYKFTLAP